MIGFLLFFALLILAMSVHEFAHSYTAYRLGDSTAKYSGRLTLNPLAHIDLLWTVLLPALFFFASGIFIAAAKPVPINYWALRNPKRDMILIGASGPLANLIFALLMSLLNRFTPGNSLMHLLLNHLIYINVMLTVFNLLPLPPLDGSRIVMGLLPQGLVSLYVKIEPYGFLIIMGLFASGMLNRLVMPLIHSLVYLLGA